MNLILSGGVGAAKDQSMIPYYAKLVPPNAKILYLPLAKRTRPFSESYERMCANMTRFGSTSSIAMWTDLKDKRLEDLAPFDSVYIEEGNPFILLNALKTSGFMSILSTYISSGKLVYGQSAGALIMGADISFAQFLSGSVENTVGLRDTRGLDLLNGYSVWPHYTPKDDPTIKRLIAEKRFTFLALPEYTGVHISSTNKTVCGAASVTVFNGASKTSHPLGSRIKF